MANEFTQQLNVFSQFLEKDITRLEQENKTKRVNNMISEAAEIFIDAENVDDAAESYTKVMKLASEHNAMEAMTFINPVYQNTIALLEKKEQEDLASTVSQRIEKITGVPIPEGVKDPMTFAKNMKILSGETITEAYDPEGTKRMLIYRVRQENGKPKVEKTWGPALGASEEALWDKFTKEERFKTKQTKEIARDKIFYTALLAGKGLAGQNLGGMTAADLKHWQNRMKENIALLDERKKGLAGIVMNRLKDTEAVTGYFNPDSPYSKNLIQKSPDLVLESLRSNADFDEALNTESEKKGWPQNPRAVQAGVPTILYEYVMAKQQIEGIRAKYNESLRLMNPMRDSGLPTQKDITSPKKEEAPTTDVNSMYQLKGAFDDINY